MNFSVYNNTPITHFYGVNTPSINTSSYVRPQKDKVSVNSDLNKLLDRRVLEDAVNANPAIASMLAAYGLRPVVNVDNFKQNVYQHCVDTKNNAMGIYNYLPVDLKAQANKNYIQQGAMLHDIGKVLIPVNILNKNTTLNPKEAEIMHLHSKLSEAILSSQNIEPEVLNIVKYHHQNRLKTGYPQMNNSAIGYDINTEIVSLADKYSALKEKRAYKKPLTDDEALSILENQVRQGEVDPRVYNALKGYVNSSKLAAIPAYSYAK